MTEHPGPTSVALPAAIRAAMIDHARAEYPNEMCGVIVGDRTAAAGGQALRWEPARNAEPSPMRYAIDPDDLLRLTIETDDADEVFWAIAHSHVRSPAVPSPTDIGAGAVPGCAVRPGLAQRGRGRPGNRRAVGPRVADRRWRHPRGRHQPIERGGRTPSTRVAYPPPRGGHIPHGRQHSTEPSCTRHILAAMAWVGGAFFIAAAVDQDGAVNGPARICPSSDGRSSGSACATSCRFRSSTFVAGVDPGRPALAVQPAVDLAGDAVLARVGDHRRAVHRPAFEEGCRDVRDPRRDGTRGSRGVRPTLPGVAASTSSLFFVIVGLMVWKPGGAS